MMKGEDKGIKGRKERRRNGTRGGERERIMKEDIYKQHRIPICTEALTCHPMLLLIFKYDLSSFAFPLLSFSFFSFFLSLSLSLPLSFSLFILLTLSFFLFLFPQAPVPQEEQLAKVAETEAEEDSVVDEEVLLPWSKVTHSLSFFLLFYCFLLFFIN